MEANQFLREEKVFLMLVGIFVSLIVVSNIIAVKIVSFGTLVGPAAVICYALTFTVTDTITEIWGKDKAKYIITIGFFAALISAVIIRVAIYLPAAPFWHYQEEYNLILGANLRIVLASMTAYLLSQYYDVWVFHFLKKKTLGKHLWLRNNLSTGTSQLIDTAIFITIAFYGAGVPIFSMILNQYLIKIIVAAGDTPVIYLMVKYVRKCIAFDFEERREQPYLFSALSKGNSSTSK